MNTMLYFVAGAKMLNAAQLAELDLGHALGEKIAQRETMKGPSGVAGVVATAEGPPADQIGYWPDRQRWTKMPGRDGRVWCGWFTDDPPGPADLARPEQIGGYPAELAGPDATAEKWLIPLGRICPTGSAFPTTIRLGPAGEIVHEPMERYSRLCALGDRLWDQVRAGNGMLDEGETIEEMTADEEFQAACNILAVNYRVSPGEVSALGLLTTANINSVLKWFVDLPGFIKLAADAAPKADGSPDGGSDSPAGEPGN